MKVNETAIAWKAAKGGKSVVVMGNEVDVAEWINQGRLYQLR